MKKEPRPSKFDIALEKGDYELPSELPARLTFIDKLIAFITFYERLGCPNNDVLYKLGKLKAHDGVIKETALELGIDPATFYKTIERLSERYEKKFHPPRPKNKKTSSL